METKGSQKRAKVSQGAFKNTPCGKGLKTNTKTGVPLPTFGSHFDSNSIRIQFKKYNKKKNANNNWNFMFKGCQNGAEIDATNHQKSMPKHVSKKIIEIIKNHVFLKCTNM